MVSSPPDFHFEGTNQGALLVVDVSFQQVYIKLNVAADKFSKESLVIQEGKLVIVETNDKGFLTEDIKTLY